MAEAFSCLGAPVFCLQTMLAVLSSLYPAIPAVIPDGVFGSRTRDAVAALQRQFGLPPTGLVDQTTWNETVAAYVTLAPLVLPSAPFLPLWQPRQAICPGEKNANLYPIQAMLLGLRSVYPQIPALELSGVHDDASVAAVQWLQQHSGLEPDGVFRQVEWLLLSALFRSAVGDGTFPL